MTLCWVCTKELEETSMGLLIKPVYFKRSTKSGRLVAEGDHFPDGQVQRIICTDCVPEIADMLGLFDQGFDFPDECAPPLGAIDILEG